MYSDYNWYIIQLHNLVYNLLFHNEVDQQIQLMVFSGIMYILNDDRESTREIVNSYIDNTFRFPETIVPLVRTFQVAMDTLPAPKLIPVMKSMDLVFKVETNYTRPTHI